MKYISVYKDYAIDTTNGKNIKLFSYSDLVINTSANAYQVIRQVYTEGQIMLVEYGGFLALDEDSYVLGYSFFSKGGIVQTTVDTQVIFKNIQLSGAKKIIFFHNHPSGNLKPSQADVEVTYLLSSLIKVLGVKFVDHIIISPLGYYSFAEDKAQSFIPLEKYAGGGAISLKLGDLDAYVSEMRLYVSENNVTDKFYSKNQEMSSTNASYNRMKKFLIDNGMVDTPCIGSMALNNALRPDMIQFDSEFDLTSQDFFIKFSEVLMSSCTCYMIIMVNKQIIDGNAFTDKESKFISRLGALAQMANLRYADILVRDILTDKFQSVTDQVVQYINSQIAGGDSKKAIKFINI